MTPKPKEQYKHFKGESKIYQIEAIARDSKNPEREIVVYKQLYDSENFPIETIWVRELNDFMGKKEFEDGTKVKRFVKI